MTEEWVPFHERLANGPKKAIPRAERFVLLELSLKSRARRGILDFPPQWTTAFAVHDLIGGDSAEIEAALVTFTSAADSAENAIHVERSALVHRLTIPKWDEWAGPKTNAERQQDYRKRKRELRPITGPPLYTFNKVTPTGQDITEQNRRESDARALDESEPPPPPPDLESDYDLGRRMFIEAWEKKYREGWFCRDATLGGSDDDHAFRAIGKWATQYGPNDRELYARHLVTMYLRDHGKKGSLDEQRHPPKWILTSVRSYGVPRMARPAPPTSETRLAAAEPLTSIEQTLERAAKLAGKRQVG